MTYVFFPITNNIWLKILRDIKIGLKTFKFNYKIPKYYFHQMKISLCIKKGPKSLVIQYYVSSILL